MSFRLAVLAREGRGGGDVLADIDPDFCDFRCCVRGLSFAFAAKGSCSTIRGDGDTDVRLFLRARGFGFWRELRVLAGGGADAGGAGEDSVGVLERWVVCKGGAGACLDGIKAVDLAASTA
jgi:hypothetical protein